MDRLKQQQGSNLDDGPNMTWLQTEANIAGFDVPIFTEQFVEHSRSRAAELRQLRKDVGELERQIETNNKNAASIRSSMTGPDSEAGHLGAQNSELQKNVNMARQTLLNCFKSANGPERVEMENLDEHVYKMSSMLKQHHLNRHHHDDPGYMQMFNYYMHVKSVISKINFNPLFS